MKTIVALDPGGSTGVAVFHEDSGSAPNAF